MLWENVRKCLVPLIAMGSWASVVASIFQVLLSLSIMLFLKLVSFYLSWPTHQFHSTFNKKALQRPSRLQLLTFSATYPNSTERRGGTSLHSPLRRSTEDSPRDQLWKNTKQPCGALLPRWNRPVSKGRRNTHTHYTLEMMDFLGWTTLNPWNTWKNRILHKIHETLIIHSMFGQLVFRFLGVAASQKSWGSPFCRDWRCFFLGLEELTVVPIGRFGFKGFFLVGTEHAETQEMLRVF